MLNFMKSGLFSCGLLATSLVHSADFIQLDFKLEDLDKKECKDETHPANGEQVGQLIGIVQDPKLWKQLIADGKFKNDQRLDKAIIIVPIEKDDLPPEEFHTLGMTAKQSLMFSGDQFQDAWCAEGHDQGTMNNRFCHSAIARSFSSWLERRGVDSTTAALAGGIFWVPKEYFVDMNPSAHDIAFTYVDKLGTKSTTVEFTVFGDAFFKHYMGRDFAPFKSSTPFITMKRKF